MNFTKLRLQFEGKEIQQWLKDNDYKINKHLLGEYQDNDERWTTYLQERAEKLARYNELEHTILTTEWVDDVIPPNEPEIIEQVEEVVEPTEEEILEDIIGENS
jgi:hypothetical protein